jgi:hypothetical protein
MQKISPCYEIVNFYKKILSEAVEKKYKRAFKNYDKQDHEALISYMPPNDPVQRQRAGRALKRLNSAENRLRSTGKRYWARRDRIIDNFIKTNPDKFQELSRQAQEHTERFFPDYSDKELQYKFTLGDLIRQHKKNNANK